MALGEETENMKEQKLQPEEQWAPILQRRTKGSIIKIWNSLERKRPGFQAVLGGARREC